MCGCGDAHAGWRCGCAPCADGLREPSIRPFTDEYKRRLTEELEKQKTKFRSVPVPKTIKSDGRQAIESKVCAWLRPHPALSCHEGAWLRVTRLDLCGGRAGCGAPIQEGAEGQLAAVHLAAAAADAEASRGTRH